MFTHGTLLFASEMENVVSALNADPDKMQSKGIKSIRSRVANISGFLREPITIDQFRTSLLQSIFGLSDIEDVPRAELTEVDWEGIRRLAEERYRNWDWNYGKSPKANVRHRKRFEGAGTIDLRLDIEEGRIALMRIFGDFFGTADVAELEVRLTGIKYERSEAEAALSDTDVRPYFGAVDKAAFLDLLLLGI
jgi:lipoate-protein ligase A